MFNLSREVTCPYCSTVNRWETSDPQPKDELICTRCREFVVSHEDYIYALVKQDVSRTMQRYRYRNVSHDLSLLKLALLGGIPRQSPETLHY